MQRLLLVLFASVLLGLVVFALAQGMKAEGGLKSPTELVAGSGPQVLRGAETYDLVCSDCHGDSGLGLAEGRLSFDPDHQRCERCHKTFNAPTKANVKLSEKNSFNIGEPPALRGAGVLAHFANAGVLHTYVRAAMPRYQPGMLSDEDYWDITAFLLEVNGLLPDGLTLGADNEAAVPLR